MLLESLSPQIPFFPHISIYSIAKMEEGMVTWLLGVKEASESLFPKLALNNCTV